MLIAAPPSDPAVNAIEAEPLPAVATSEVGAAGVVAGVNDEDATEAAPLPATFTARSFTVYATPLVTPMLAGDEVVPRENQDPEPFNWYSYPVINDPPVDPAVNSTETVESPGLTEVMLGAPGTVRGVKDDDATEAAPLPALFTARNFTVYAVPLDRPLIVIGDEVPTASTQEPLPN